MGFSHTHLHIFVLCDRDTPTENGKKKKKKNGSKRLGLYSKSVRGGCVVMLSYMSHTQHPENVEWWALPRLKEHFSDLGLAGVEKEQIKSHFEVPCRLVYVMLHPEHLSWHFWFSLGVEQLCSRCHSMHYWFITLKWVQLKHEDSLRETIYASGLDVFSKWCSTTSLVSCSHSWIHLSSDKKRNNESRKLILGTDVWFLGNSTFASSFWDARWIQ